MHAPAGLKGIVNNTQWCSDLQSKSPTSRRHALAEAIFDAFATPAVHLRGAVYNTNAIAQLLPAAMQAGVLRAPSMAADDQLPLIAGIDVAAAADAVLKNFSAYAGQVCFQHPRLPQDGCAHSISREGLQCTSALSCWAVTYQILKAETDQPFLIIVMPGVRIARCGAFCLERLSADVPCPAQAILMASQLLSLEALASDFSAALGKKVGV